MRLYILYRICFPVNTTVHNFRWQRHVVHKMIERIASIIVTSKQTNDERERRVKEVEHRLSLLENKLKQVGIHRLFTFHIILVILMEIKKKGNILFHQYANLSFKNIVSQPYNLLQFICLLQNVSLDF